MQLKNKKDNNFFLSYLFNFFQKINKILLLKFKLKKNEGGGGGGGECSSNLDKLKKDCEI